LTSDDPCGFTAGPYDHSFPNNNEISYGGYDFWAQQGAATLLDLLTTYNNETAGDTSGTLGDWMNSVGFGNAQDKIVLTPNTGNNWGTTTVCFLDTSINRSSAKQPWCDAGGGVESTDNLTKIVNTGTCGNGCSFQDLSQADFTGSSVASDFYTMNLTVTDKTDGTTYDWHTRPGWLTEEQGNAEFHHFHWPAFEVNSRQMGSDWCTVRNPGTLPEDNVNPGGIPTMCGRDLQTWLDAVLEDPEVSFQCGRTDADANGASKALTDGLLIIRHLFGFTGSTLTEGALAPDATRTDPAAIAAHIEANRTAFDIDLNGGTDALTDGLLIIRRLFGLSGATLTEGTLAPDASRTDPEQIAASIDELGSCSSGTNQAP
jgi:hypothetical protein